MTKHRHVFLITVVLALLILLTSLACAMPVSSDFITLTVLTVNDFHGAMAESGNNPGAAKLAKFLKDQQAINPQGTLILSAGDMFQGSPDSNMLYGKTVVSFMNEVGFAATTIGNHEFDWGMDKLRERMIQSQFPYLAANCFDKQTNQPVFTPYVMIEKYGIKIAVIGIATPETTYKTNSKVIESYYFAEPAAVVKALLPKVRSQGAEVVIVLSHLGCEAGYKNSIHGEAADFAQKVSGIDLLVTGHTHTKIAGTVNNIPIVQANYNGRAVGKVNLVYSRMDKKVISAMVNVFDLPTHELTDDAAVKQIVDAAQLEIAPVKNTVLGRTVKTLTHDRFHFSLLGQWTSDIMRQAANADIAFQNGGGLRAPIEAGDITTGDLYEVIPFDNRLFTVELTGNQIVKVLEHGISNPKYGMVQFSGIHVKYDESRPKGKRVVEVKLNNGRNLVADKYYKVATNDFMAFGGDEFFMFKEGRNKTDTNLPIRDILSEAIRKAKIVDYKGDNRLVVIKLIEIKPVA